ncbi:hypothetical protein [Deinococcus ruber]|uniref:Uncharacterized protein n=1 Tax=Deinococcus ruber TaxID=1848197 RepID=A0A918CML7_9DEIO|nr:hypothetical protein [Deinococcus ruber]GGR32926.1 hypothetical protein GCM10008957_49150 [Deinococcus ruber]
MTEQQQWQVIQRAMELGLNRGITQKAKDSDTIRFAQPINGRQHLAGSLTSARSQLEAANLQAELIQAAAELADTFAAQATRSTARQAAVIRHANRQAQLAAEQCAQDAAIRAADRALDNLYAQLASASDATLARVQGLLVTRPQRTRFAQIRDYVLEIRPRRGSPTPISTAISERFLSPAHTALDVGSFVGEDVRMVVTGHSCPPFYRSPRVIDDAYLFEFEGVLMPSVHDRPATHARRVDGEQLAVQRGRERQQAETDPATDAGIIRCYVEAHGTQDSTAGALEQTLYT